MTVVFIYFLTLSIKTEQSDRIGPRPPPPPLTPEKGQVLPKEPSLPPKTKQPEPDYEVIEFSNQQYSNATLRPNSASSGSKTPGLLSY